MNVFEHVCECVSCPFLFVCLCLCVYACVCRHVYVCVSVYVCVCSWQSSLASKRTVHSGPELTGANRGSWREESSQQQWCMVPTESYSSQEPPIDTGAAETTERKQGVYRCT